MSRHWKPEIVRERDWTQANAYRLGGKGKLAVLVLGAVFAGLAGGFGWQWWTSRPMDSGPSSAIEWNAVQAVPTRAPDAQDIEWQKRAEDSDSSPLAGEVGGGPAASAAEETLSTPPPNPPHKGEGGNGAIYVIDGDTFAIGNRRIRIMGMDAPETHPSRCLQEAQLGNAATERLKALLASGNVTISGSGRDQYGRELRQVFVNGVDVAQTMIADGLASSYSGGKRQGWC